MAKAPNVQMITRKPHSYGGRKRRFGDQFEVAARDVPLVKLMGWGVTMDEDKPKAVPAPKRAAVTRKSSSTAAAPAEDPPPVVTGWAAPTPSAVPDADQAAAPPVIAAPTPMPTAAPTAGRGTYQRRDMTAEGS